MIKYFLPLIIWMLFTSCAKHPAKGQSVIKVMSYNMRIANPPSKPGFTDIQAIADVINGSDPDVVALQEVDVNTDRSGPTLDQAKKLSELTHMEYFFAKAINRSGGEYGVAILSKQPIVTSVNIPLPVIDGTGAELRNAALAVIGLPDNKKIVFVSTHLDHLKSENRFLQAQVLLDKLKAYRDDPIILAGDFNSRLRLNEAALDTLRNWFTIGCTECPFTFSATKPWATIDYIMLNKAASKLFNVINYQTIDNKQTEYASDHLPIVAELRINE